MMMELREALARADGLPPSPTEEPLLLAGEHTGSLVAPRELTQTVIRLLDGQRWRKSRAAVRPFGGAADGTPAMAVPVSAEGTLAIERYQRDAMTPFPNDLARLLVSGDIRWTPGLRPCEQPRA